MIPVVIGTNPERGPWLRDCLTSIRRTSRYRRVHVHRDGGYELTALRAAMTRYDRFLFVHDSCEILHSDFWGAVDNTGPTWLFGGPPMYLGVYNSLDLRAALTDAPSDVDKQTSIRWESELPNRLPCPTLWPEVNDATGRIEEHHGRRNLILENRYLRKWKGTWS